MLKNVAPEDQTTKFKNLQIFNEREIPRNKARKHQQDNMAKKRVVFPEKGISGIREPQRTSIKNANFCDKPPNALKQSTGELVRTRGAEETPRNLIFPIKRP